VGHKGSKQWILLALDVHTHENLGFHVGDRSINKALGIEAPIQNL
jgi:hypothetical protein